MPFETISDVMSALRSIAQVVSGEDVTRLDEFRAAVALRDLGLSAVEPAIEHARADVRSRIDRIVETTVNMPHLGVPVRLRLGPWAREVLDVGAGEKYATAAGLLEVEETDETYIITTVTDRELARREERVGRD